MFGLSANVNTMSITKYLKPAEMQGGKTLWDQRLSMQPRLAAGAAILVLVLAIPNLRRFMSIWNDDPSYNHGYLVIPIAVFILWQRLSTPEPKVSAETALAPWWDGFF